MNNMKVIAIESAIAELDLEPIIYKLVHPDDPEEAWSLDLADTVAELYRHFLLLCALYPDESIVPTKQVDKFWHVHILDTAKYAEDCEMVFGRFLHHFPYFGMRGEDDALALKGASERTKQLHMEYFDSAFGPISPTNDATTCGASCGDSLCSNTACDSNDCKPSISSEDRPRVNRAA